METDLKPALELIKRFEGLRLKAYLCPARVPTIGYGTTRYPNDQRVKMGDVITVEEAEELLLHDIQKFVLAVNVLVKVDITSNQFCALVSFCYNLGQGALKRSTLLQRLNNGQQKEVVAEEFMKWTRAGGKVLAGLVRRRKDEKALFLS